MRTSGLAPLLIVVVAPVVDDEDWLWLWLGTGLSSVCPCSDGCHRGEVMMW